MYSQELLKGTLSAMLLALLAEHGRMYGYEMAQKVKLRSGNRILLREGSLYPALHKLEAEGLVAVETVRIGKRVRRYYSLTPTGAHAKQDRLQELRHFMAALDAVLFGDNPPQPA